MKHYQVIGISKHAVFQYQKKPDIDKGKFADLGMQVNEIRSIYPDYEVEK